MWITRLNTPHITIDYRFYVQNLSSDQEYVTALQQISSAVTSGQAADIYLLDSLPYQDYAKKGCLADITELTEAYVRDEEYFGKVIESIRSSDGKFYAVPQFFMAQCVVVRDEDNELEKEFAGSIHDFASFLKAHPDSKGLLGYYFKDRPDNFMTAIYQFYGNELWKNGEITRESVKDFLESASVIYNHLQQNSVQKISPYDYHIN